MNTLQQNLSAASGTLVSSVSTTIGGDADSLKDNRITYGNNAADGDKNWITKWSETMVDGSASGSKADDKWAEKNVEVEADYVLAQAQSDWEQKLRNAVIDRDYQYLQLEDRSAAQWRHDERQYAIDMEQSRALHMEAMNAAKLARVTDLGTAGQTWSSDWGDTRIAQTTGLNSGDSAYVGALNSMESGWATGESARETTLVSGLGSSATTMFGSVGDAAAGFQEGLGENIVDRSYGGKKAEGTYARDHYQTTNALLLSPPSGMTRLATSQNPFDTQIRSSYLAGMVDPNANLQRGVVKAEMDRQAEKTDAAGDWLAGQSGAFSTFDNSQVTLEGGNWTTSVGAGGGWLSSVTGSQNSGVAAIVGQDKTLDVTYAGSEKAYAVTWTTAQGVYELGMLNSSIAYLIAEDAALLIYDTDTEAEVARHQAEVNAATDALAAAVAAAEGDQETIAALHAAHNAAMVISYQEHTDAIAEIDGTRDESLGDASEQRETTNAALDLAWRTAEADAELERTVAQRNADFDWQKLVINQNTTYAKAYALAGKTLADTLAEADADLLSGLGDASEQLTNESAEEDADEFERNADADKEARTATGTAQGDHRGEDYASQSVALTPTSGQVPFVCNERTWCPVPTGEVGVTTLVPYGQRWTTSAVPAWAQYHAEVANQKATWWDEIGYGDFTLTIENINDAHDTYTNGTKAGYLDMAEALGAADALWADTVSTAGETAVNNISTAEKTYADLLADKTKTYQDLEAEADRDRAIAKAQALRDYKINNDGEAKNAADEAAEDAYHDTVDPAATAFNIDTAIADGQRQVTVANEELEFSLAGINADYEAALTETNSIFDFVTDEADALEALAHDVADRWKDWKINDATQVATAFGNANVPSALAYKAFENATQNIKAQVAVAAATQMRDNDHLQATAQKVETKSNSEQRKELQTQQNTAARDVKSEAAVQQHHQTQDGTLAELARRMLNAPNEPITATVKNVQPDYKVPGADDLNRELCRKPTPEQWNCVSSPRQNQNGIKLSDFGPLFGLDTEIALFDGGDKVTLPAVVENGVVTAEARTYLMGNDLLEAADDFKFHYDVRSWADVKQRLQEHTKLYGRVSELWVFDHGGTASGKQSIGHDYLDPNQFGEIKQYLTENAKVYLMGCSVGVNKNGYCNNVAKSLGEERTVIAANALQTMPHFESGELPGLPDFTVQPKARKLVDGKWEYDHSIKGTYYQFKSNGEKEEVRLPTPWPHTANDPPPKQRKTFFERRRDAFYDTYLREFRGPRSNEADDDLD